MNNTNNTTDEARARRIRFLVRMGYAANEVEAAAKVDAEKARGEQLRAEREAAATRRMHARQLRGKGGRFETLGSCSFCSKPLGCYYYDRAHEGGRAQCCADCAD